MNLQRSFRTDAPRAVALIRFMVGLVFASEGIQKFLYAEVAIASTKVPILLGHGYWIFAHTFAPKAGFWSFLHESRTDISMLCGSAFVAIVGAGPWSLDGLAVRRNATRAQAAE